MKDNAMSKFGIRMLVLLALLLSALSLHAQDEETELPEIPYYRASSNFNVPILELNGWTDASTPDEALFTHDALNARLHVMMVRTLDDDEAIQTAISRLIGEERPQLLYNSRIGLANGTWTQQLFSIDETSISSYALVRGDRTFVVTLIETSPDYAVYELAIRTPALTNSAEPEPDFDAGVNLALQEFLGDDTEYSLAEENQQTVLGTNAALYTFSVGESELTVFALHFDFITYATIVEGNADIAAELGEAFNSVFLGFFITPDNSQYLFLALTMVAIIFTVLIGSMWLRYRNVQKDMALVEELAEKE
jgi:hypothetical protein